MGSPELRRKNARGLKEGGWGHGRVAGARPHRLGLAGARREASGHGKFHIGGGRSSVLVEHGENGYGRGSGRGKNGAGAHPNTKVTAVKPEEERRRGNSSPEVKTTRGKSSTLEMAPVQIE